MRHEFLMHDTLAISRPTCIKSMGLAAGQAGSFLALGYICENQLTASLSSPGSLGRTTSLGVPGGNRTHRLRPWSNAFHADVARGSICRPEPLRGGPMTIHLHDSTCATRHGVGIEMAWRYIHSHEHMFPQYSNKLTSYTYTCMQRVVQKSVCELRRHYAAAAGGMYGESGVCEQRDIQAQRGTALVMYTKLQPSCRFG